MALITDLPAASSVANTDVFIMDTGSVTNKITAANLFKATTAAAGIFSTYINAAKTFTISNSYRGVMYILDSNTSQCGEYLVESSGSGAVGNVAVKSASGITITNGTNALTLTPTSGTRTLLFLIASGTITE